MEFHCLEILFQTTWIYLYRDRTKKYKEADDLKRIYKNDLALILM